jgi:hypothetical protein
MPAHRVITLMAIVLIAVALLALPALAGPAPWYQWRSKLNGRLVCAQTSPGEGWALDSGPYKDSRCEQPGIRS